MDDVLLALAVSALIGAATLLVMVGCGVLLGFRDYLRRAARQNQDGESMAPEPEYYRRLHMRLVQDRCSRN